MAAVLPITGWKPDGSQPEMARARGGARTAPSTAPPTIPIQEPPEARTAAGATDTTDAYVAAHPSSRYQRRHRTTPTADVRAWANRILGSRAEPYDGKPG